MLSRPSTTLFPTAFSVLLLLAGNRCLAQNYTWAATTGGSWTNGLNWGTTPGDYPNSPTARATFSSSVNGSPMTVTLDSAVTIRRLNFNTNQSGAVTIASGTGGTLTFDDPETGQPSLSVVTGTGTHTITADVTIQGPIAHKWNIGANQTFTVNGNIGGPQGITKLDTGTLLLNGVNTYSGPTTVTLGTLGGSGSLASAVTTAADTTLSAGTSASAPTLTLNNGLSLGGRYLVTLFTNDSISRLDIPAGTATISAGALEVALGPAMTVEGFRAGGARSFTVIDAGSGQLSGTFSATNFTSAGFSESEWTVSYDNTSGNVTLNFSPVPEPPLALALGVAGLLVVWRIRRQFPCIVAPVHVDRPGLRS